MDNVVTIRVCLNADGTFHAFPYLESIDDYADEKMEPEKALELMTGGKVTIEVATADPKDNQPHNYEANCIVLQRI